MGERRRVRALTGLLGAGLLAVVLAAAGCGTATGSNAAGTPSRSPGPLPPVSGGERAARAVATADTRFGLTLFHRICAGAPTANVTMSPLSAAQALGMLDAGAVGATRAAVDRLLQLPGWDRQMVAALSAQQRALAAVPQLTVVNHVFEQHGLAPSTTTLADLRTAFGANLVPVDFAAEPATVNAINAVVSRDTDHLVPALFGSLDPSTQTVLVNALLLDARWRTPFALSEPEAFHTASGGRVTAPMMQNPDAVFAGRSVDGWRSVVLPYRGSLQAVALLPPAGSAGASAAACATPTPDQLVTLTTGRSTPTEVALPKLDLSTSHQLAPTLAAMGLPLVGNYSGLGAGDSTISQVVQKVVMKVDLTGTRAAAATGIAIGTSARVGGATVTFNRPFLLMVEDVHTGTPLFVARVTDPNVS
jgi:serpin B